MKPRCMLKIELFDSILQKFLSANVFLRLVEKDEIPFAQDTETSNFDTSSSNTSGLVSSSSLAQQASPCLENMS